MDCSPEYILMCDCPEIQGQRPISHLNRITRKVTEDLWVDGDWFIADGELYVYGGDCCHLKRYDDEPPCLSNAGYMEGDGGCVNKVIWLPHQYQLQAMVLPDPNAKDAWGEPFEKDLKSDDVFWLFLDFSKSLQERKRSQQTGEQLWLRYVMKEKYNKVWSNDKWIE